jgi:hypothetical protein
MSKLFTASKLVLNFIKTNIIKFITKNLIHSALHFGYKVEYIEVMVYKNFLDYKLITT